MGSKATVPYAVIRSKNMCEYIPRSTMGYIFLYSRVLKIRVVMYVTKIEKSGTANNE